MSSSYIDYPLKHRHGLGRETNSPDYYNHTRVQTAGRSTLPEISQYPNVHKLFRNEVISTTTNNEEQVHEDNNIGSRPKNHGPKSQTTPAVRLVKKVEVSDRDEEEDDRTNGNSEVLHEETTLEQDADGYLEKKHKRFLCKWKSYKDYYQVGKEVVLAVVDWQAKLLLSI